MKKVKIGVVGCGAISGIYLTNLTTMFANTEVVGVCDLIPERAKAAAEKHNLRVYRDMHAMFDDISISLILNLTRPYEHFDVNMAAIAKRKHVYAEKPLGATFEEGVIAARAARESNVMLGGAPDTFMGAGQQTSRGIVGAGIIGTPVAAVANFACRGHESWHPDPEFYYKAGGGPMMDMGPYYVTALVNLLGPVKVVTGFAKKSFPTRTITSKPHDGTKVDVDVPTHIAGQMLFECGAVASIITSFDIHSHKNPIIEVYGSTGTLCAPDPNTFGGPVMVYLPDTGYIEMPLSFPHETNSRGLGVSDMAAAILDDKLPRAGLSLALHVLEVLCAFEKASESGKSVEITTRTSAPEPMPADA